MCLFKMKISKLKVKKSSVTTSSGCLCWVSICKGQSPCLNNYGMLIINTDAQKREFSKAKIIAKGQLFESLAYIRGFDSFINQTVSVQQAFKELVKIFAKFPGEFPL